MRVAGKKPSRTKPDRGVVSLEIELSNQDGRVLQKAATSSWWNAANRQRRREYEFPGSIQGSLDLPRWKIRIAAMVANHRI